MRFEVHAGSSARPAGPVSVSLSADQAAQIDAPGLIDTKTKQPVPVQRLPEGGLCWAAPELQADERRVFALDTDGLSNDSPRVVVDQDHPEQIEVRIGDKAFTTLNFAISDEHPRPFLYPLIGPTHMPVTRHYPMRAGVPGEREDHPHHQSCWVAWGKINGVDHWSTSDKCGFQRVRALTTTISGPVFGQIEAVMNHYGTKDFWAARAHESIPDAGPAGRRGFDFYRECWPADKRDPPDRVLLNVAAPGFGHSRFFKNDDGDPSTMRRQFSDVWEPFLTTRDMPDLPKFVPHEPFPAERWRQRRWPRRAITGWFGKARNTVKTPG